MRASIESVLRAEQQAKTRLEQAHQRAQRIRDDAEAYGRHLLETAIAQARTNAESTRQKSAARAQVQADAIRSTAQEKASAVVVHAGDLDLSALTNLIHRIAGLER